MNDSHLSAFYDAFEHAECALGRSTGHGIALTLRGNGSFTVQLIRVTGREEPPFIKTRVAATKEDVHTIARTLGGPLNDPAPLVFLEEVRQKRWVLVDAESLLPREDTQFGGISREFEAA